MRCAPMILLACLIGGCTPFPELDGTVPPQVLDAPFPILQPVDPILENTFPDPGALARQSQDALSRVAALQARARTLRARQIIDRPTRARLDQAMATAPR